MKLINKIVILLAAVSLVSMNIGIANAQTVSSSISSTLKNAVDVTKENGAKNSLMRNQLVAEHSADLQNKEKALADQLNIALLNLENIQTRIANKTAETAASGTDMTSVNMWLATSSEDILTAQTDITIFASSTIGVSSTSALRISIMQARKLADNAISSVNTAHDDLQSALDALTAIL